MVISQLLLGKRCRVCNFYFEKISLLPFSPGNPRSPTGPGVPGNPGVPITPISPLGPDAKEEELIRKNKASSVKKYKKQNYLLPIILGVALLKEKWDKEDD